jgi:AraC-like DNA-binding protein
MTSPQLHNKRSSEPNKRNKQAVAPRKVYALTLRKVRSYLEAHGVDSASLIDRTELTAADLENPYQLISETQARQFYRNAINLYDDPGFGLDLGWTTDLTELGSFGLIQLVARSVREAVERSADNYRTYYGLVDYVVDDRGDNTVFRLLCQEEDPVLRTFLIERAVGVFQAGCEELVGPEGKPNKVLLDYPAPPHRKRYEEVLRCPIHFGQPRCEVHYPTRFLEQELANYDPEALQALGVLQSQLMNKLSAEKDVVAEVKLALRRTPGSFPNLERVAEGLAMSPRTLRRKLGAANARFQDLLDAERRRVAEEYLADSDLSVQQIADLCGFSDAQNFSQAFKRWLGVSPTEYRRSHREDSQA